jgi:hypothetical protein
MNLLRGPLQRILAVGLTALLASQAAAATKTKKVKNPPPPPGSGLSGKITGYDGKPVRGATVTVKSLDGTTSWTSLPSDKWGKYKLQGLRYGWAEVTVTTGEGNFLGDQAMNLPPGKKVEVSFSLLETRDKPASWWADRRVEVPKGDSAAEVAGMAQSNQKLTGVEYWKSPAGIAIIVGAAVVALAFIGASGRKYN